MICQHPDKGFTLLKIWGRRSMGPRLSTCSRLSEMTGQSNAKNCSRIKQPKPPSLCTTHSKLTRGFFHTYFASHKHLSPFHNLGLFAEFLKRPSCHWNQITIDEHSLDFLCGPRHLFYLRLIVNLVTVFPLSNKPTADFQKEQHN